jgi:sensor histidine kinase YesM
MLIQPHAENAIKHGITPKGSKGNLVIDIRSIGRWIICSVTDDGVGRPHSRLLNEKRYGKHRSRGIELTRERLDVLAMLSGGQYKFNVVDLTDGKGIAAGTRVEICIPAENE